MIESFVICSANGYMRPPSVFPPEVPIMDFLKPEYQPTHYAWVADGVAYTRKCDAIETCSIEVAPNMKYLIVTQNSSKYGANNLLVLNQDGTDERRLVNPYLSSSEYKPGDKCEFLGVQNVGNKVLAKIAVTRTLPDSSYKSEPTYVTFYDCDTWESSPLEFIDSRNL
jgi:hypothetical protein